MTAAQRTSPATRTPTAAATPYADWRTAGFPFTPGG